MALKWAPKAKSLLLNLIQIFARAVLVMKKLEIKETKTTQYSTFKTDTIKVGLVFSISHFFITKTARANKSMGKKIPSCSNSALVVLDQMLLKWSSILE